MSSTRPNPTHLGWVEFFWPTMVGYVKKSPQLDPTRPMHTLNLLWFWKFEVDFGWRVWCCNIWSWFFFGCLTWIGWSRSNGGLVVADLRWVVAFVVDSVRERWSEREKVGERGQKKNHFFKHWQWRASHHKVEWYYSSLVFLGYFEEIDAWLNCGCLIFFLTSSYFD